jgi:hypothetical protein
MEEGESYMRSNLSKKPAGSTTGRRQKFMHVEGVEYGAMYVYRGDPLGK